MGSRPYRRRSLFFRVGAPMTSEEQEHMMKLCKQIQVEQDQQKFTQLIQELTALLDGKICPLGGKSPPPNTKSQQAQR